MKLIFLDIDGVLNCQSTKSRYHGIIGVDLDKARLLKHIIECTGAEIVLTSSWKNRWYPEYESQGELARYLTDTLHALGLRILDRTYDPIDSGYRGAGIKNYLDNHPTVESWVVLDDEIFPDYEEQGIMPHLVKSSFYKDGLTAELTEQAINMLEEQNNE